MTQLSFFGMDVAAGPDVAIAVRVAADGGLEAVPLAAMIADADLARRAALVLVSAALWQGFHDASGLQHSVDGKYAAELRRVAEDMAADPVYYLGLPVTQPVTVQSDMRWYRAKGGK